MKEIILARDARLALRSQAHHLDPVVLLGANGLTNAVLHEIDRALNDHELIKVRVPSDDREELESIYAEVAEKLGAARVQMIGKLLIFWRPADESERQDPDEAARLAIPKVLLHLFRQIHSCGQIAESNSAWYSSSSPQAK